MMEFDVTIEGRWQRMMDLDVVAASAGHTCRCRHQVLTPHHPPIRRARQALPALAPSSQQDAPPVEQPTQKRLSR